jgi:hypothetical protein
MEAGKGKSRDLGLSQALESPVVQKGPPRPPQVSESIAREIRDCAGQPGIPCGTRRIATAVTKSGRVSVQLRVLRFGFLQDGNVGIGFFPDVEEVLAATARKLGTGIIATMVLCRAGARCRIRCVFARRQESCRRAKTEMFGSYPPENS